MTNLDDIAQQMLQVYLKSGQLIPTLQTLSVLQARNDENDSFFRIRYLRHFLSHLNEEQLEEISQQNADTLDDQAIVKALIFFHVGHRFYTNLTLLDDNFNQAYKFNGAKPEFAISTFCFWSNQKETYNLLAQYLQKADQNFQNHCKNKVVKHLINLDESSGSHLLNALPFLPISGDEAFQVWLKENQYANDHFGCIVESTAECLRADTTYYANRTHLCAQILKYISNFSRDLDFTQVELLHETLELIDNISTKHTLVRNIDMSQTLTTRARKL